MALQYNSLMIYFLSFLWKRQFERREKNEKRKVKRTKRNDNLLPKKCRFFLSMGYKKDIFAVFAYDFELSQKFKRNHTFPFVRKAY